MKAELKNDNFISILYEGIEYRINIKKLEAVFSLLENKQILIKSNEQVSELLTKYKLYDKSFFENVNKI